MDENNNAQRRWVFLDGRQPLVSCPCAIMQILNFTIRCRSACSATVYEPSSREAPTWRRRLLWKKRKSSGYCLNRRSGILICIHVPSSFPAFVEQSAWLSACRRFCKLSPGLLSTLSNPWKCNQTSHKGFSLKFGKKRIDTRRPLIFCLHICFLNQ